MMKRIFCIIVTMTICLFSVSCINLNEKAFDPHNGGWDTYRQLQEMTKEKSLEVLECFDNHDKERLMEMFAPAVSSEYSLNEQIDKAFEIYDSKSVEYERFSAQTKSSSLKEGVYYRRNFEGYFNNIELESGDVFEISVNICYVDDENPDKIGIYSIYLADGGGVNLRIIGEYNEIQKELAE